MWINGRIYRRFRQPNTPIRVQLGPGVKYYLDGWVNVDANFLTARVDLWANLTDPLPFRSDSVQTFYSHHVVEHLPDSYLRTHFREMYRTLVPGGGIRVGGPDIGNACRKFVEDDLDWFDTYPTPRSLIGGRFANLVFCDGDHLTALSESFLRELATDAGFVDIRRCMPTKESSLVGPEVLSHEYETDFDCPHTIIIEARKPIL